MSRVEDDDDDSTYLSSVEAQYYSPDEKWARLQAMMTRKIYFAQTVGEHHFLIEVVILPFVFSYAELNRLDPTPTAK